MNYQDFTNAQSVLEVSRDAVFIIADERIVYANKYAVQVLGFLEPSEIVGKWACEFVSPDQKRAKFRASESSSPFRYEMMFRRSIIPICPAMVDAICVGIVIIRIRRVRP